jgi:hypothetical protein
MGIELLAWDVPPPAAPSGATEKQATAPPLTNVAIAVKINKVLFTKVLLINIEAI